MRGLVMLLLCSVCVTAGAAEDAQEYYEPGIDLPDGQGRELILRACTHCHNLEGVPAYRKYWGFDRWLPMVENMIEHGAKLDETEKVIVAKYLGRNFGIDG